MDDELNLLEQNQLNELSSPEDEFVVVATDAEDIVFKRVSSGNTVDTSYSQRLCSIERALQRIVDGSYGYCLNCGAEIEIDALRENPAVETCNACSSDRKFKVS